MKRMASGLIQFPQNGDMCWTFLNITINSTVHKMQIIFFITHTAQSLVEIRGKSRQIKQRLATR